MSIRSLGKQSLIYGTGHILARLVTFLLLPLYTNVFSAKEYGVVALFYTFLSFMNVIMRYGLGAAFLKFYVPADREERRAIFSNVIFSLFITGIPFFYIWHLCRYFLSPLLLGVYEPSYITIMGAIIVLDTIWSIPLLGYRAENRPGLFTIFSLLNVGITIGLNLFFILGKGLGINAIFLSNLSASALIFILTLPYIYQRFKFDLISKNQWRTILNFALPFLPAGLFSMFMEVADRYILKYFTDLSTVGIYNAGYKVGMLMMLSVTAFNFGWQPFFLENGKKDNQGELFGRVSTLALAVFGYIWLLLVIWVDELLRINIGGYSFFGREFESALSIVPWIGLGYLFYGFYILQTPGIFLKDRPGIAAWTRFIGAIANIGLCLLLIPFYNELGKAATGAAIATCISFMIMFIVMYYQNKKLYPIQLEWTNIGLLAVFIFVGFIISNFMGDNPFLNIIITIMYPYSLIKIGIIRLKLIQEFFGKSL